MPESIATDNTTVATIIAAMELVKVTQTPSRSPDTLAAAFKTIFRAIIEARQGK